MNRGRRRRIVNGAMTVLCALGLIVALIPLVSVLWLVIGVLVASNHHYFANLSSFSGVVSALLAVLLWPLVLLGTTITITV